jgi:hypothetical protein
MRILNVTLVLFGAFLTATIPALTARGAGCCGKYSYAGPRCAGVTAPRLSCAAIRCTPVRCAPARCVPVRRARTCCVPVRCAPVCAPLCCAPSYGCCYTYHLIVRGVSPQLVQAMLPLNDSWRYIYPIRR